MRYYASMWLKGLQNYRMSKFEVNPLFPMMVGTFLKFFRTSNFNLWHFCSPLRHTDAHSILFEIPFISWMVRYIVKRVAALLGSRLSSAYLVAIHMYAYFHSCVSRLQYKSLLTLITRIIRKISGQCRFICFLRT